MEIDCPRCEARLVLPARHGGSYACESCRLAFEVRDGQALHDPAEAAAARHEIHCPGCDEPLAFWARTGDVFRCPACDQRLEVAQGRVLYRRDTLAQQPSPEIVDLTDDQRALLRRLHEAAMAELDQRDVRRIVGKCAPALDALMATGSNVAVRSAHQGRLMARMLDDWWNEKASFSWTTASQLAAALSQVTTLTGSEREGKPIAYATDHAYVLGLALEAARPDVQRYLREQRLDPEAFDVGGEA